MKEFTIIIPTFENFNYINQCLDSVINQHYQGKYEILIGIDNSINDLNFLKKSEYFKNDNVKIYFSNENVGCYLLRNSLWAKAKYDNILFFDMDDIMHPNMIDVLNEDEHQAIIKRFRFFQFKDFDLENLTDGNMYAHGVFYTHRILYKMTGGFMPWVCGADSEFIERCAKHNYKPYDIDVKLFYRRIHQNNLTRRADTGMGSDIRNRYQQIVLENRRNPNQPLKIKEITIPLKKIN